MKRKIIQAIISGILVSGIVLTGNSINVSAVSKVEVKDSDVSVTQTAITINVKGNYIYRLEDGLGNVLQDWVTPTGSQVVFSGLKPNTDYEVAYRLPDNEDIVGWVDVKTLKLEAAAPDVSRFTTQKPSLKGANDGKIFGADESMEYSWDGGKNWYPAWGDTIYGVKAGNILIRYYETDTHAASPYVTVVLEDADNGKKGVVSAPDEKNYEVVNVSVNGGNDGKILGIFDGIEYSTDSGKTWAKLPGGATSIDGLSAGVVQLRYYETDLTMASNRIYLTISEPAAKGKKEKKLTPRIEDYTVMDSVKGGKTGRIEGVSEYMEYSLDGGESWIPVKGYRIDGLGAGEVLLRYSETERFLGSDSIKFTIKEVDKAANKSKPDITKIKVYDAPRGFYWHGRIEGLDNTMEYSIDNGATWASISGNYTDMVPAGKVLIRYKETETTLPGDSIEVTVGSRDVIKMPKPDVSSFKVKNATKGHKDGRIDVIKEGMYYSVNGGKSWERINGTVIEGLGAGEVLIKYPEGRYEYESETVSVFISEEDVPSQYEGDSIGDNDYYTDDAAIVKTSDTANSSILYTIVLGALSLGGLALSKLKKIRIK